MERRRVLKYVVALATFGAASALSYDRSQALRTGQLADAVGMSQAQAVCGTGMGCSGGGGMCGTGMNCSGGGGMCGTGMNCGGR